MALRGAFRTARSSAGKGGNAMTSLVDAAHSLETIVVCGKVLIGDASGALYWPDERTLVVADLHLEKGSSAAGRGTLLPPYDSQATLMKLAEVIDKYDPARRDCIRSQPVIPLLRGQAKRVSPALIGGLIDGGNFRHTVQGREVRLPGMIHRVVERLHGFPLISDQKD